MQNFYMNLNGKWWELYDRKGNLWKLASVSEFDLNSAVTFFTRYLENRSVKNPVICEYSEIFLQG